MFYFCTRAVHKIANYSQHIITMISQNFSFILVRIFNHFKFFNPSLKKKNRTRSNPKLSSSIPHLLSISNSSQEQRKLEVTKEISPSPKKGEEFQKEQTNLFLSLSLCLSIYLYLFVKERISGPRIYSSLNFY